MSAQDVFVVRGGGALRGRLRVPGDKGIAHRCLMFAALAHGPSRITGMPDGADVASTRACLASLGVEITDRATEDGTGEVEVSGRGADDLTASDAALDCGNSGTTMRLLAGLLAGCPLHSELVGDHSLSLRPMARVVEPLRAMGARISARGDGERPPLVIDGGHLHAATHTLDVASAQVKTALVLAGLRAEGRTVIAEPAPSRDHTERLLEAMGAPIERIDATTIAVSAGVPRNFEVTIPGDPSSAAFFAVAAAIVEGSDIVLEHVSVNPTRLGFVEVLARMGADISVSHTGTELGEPVGEIRVRSGPLVATTIGGDEIPRVIDELPVLAVAAAVAVGDTVVADAGELRVKETDRIDALEQELARLGIDVDAAPDGFTVRGGASPNAAELDSHGDHRIAMAAAVAGLLGDGATTIRGWDAVKISYPEFPGDLEALRGSP